MSYGKIFILLLEEYTLYNIKIKLAREIFKHYVLYEIVEILHMKVENIYQSYLKIDIFTKIFKYYVLLEMIEILPRDITFMPIFIKFATNARRDIKITFTIFHKCMPVRAFENFVDFTNIDFYLITDTIHKRQT